MQKTVDLSLEIQPILESHVHVTTPTLNQYHPKNILNEYRKFVTAFKNHFILPISS